MRIMHILEATLGGTRRYVNDLFYASRPEDDHFFVYGTARADGAFWIMLNEMKGAGWQTEALNFRRNIDLRSDIACTIRLRRIVQRFSPDILHAHSSKAGAISRLAVFGMRPRPSIIYSPNAIAVRLGYRYHLVERILASQTQVLAAISPSEKSELQSLHLVPPDRLRVIVPTLRGEEWIPEDRGAARAKLGLPNAPLVIGIGRLSSQKDPLAFVRVIGALRERRPDVRGIWIGDGDMRGEVERAIAAARLETTVSIAGWQDDVRPYLAASDVFLSTATYESFGYVTAEALAMDRPAVASAITGTIDILTLDRKLVLYTPHDDNEAAAKIDALLANADLARAVAARGRAGVLERFSLAATRQGLDEAVEAALPRRNAAIEMQHDRPRIAIVSDPLVQRGGAERVVEAMARIFAQAPVFALLYSEVLGPKSLANRIIASPLSLIPGAARRHRFLLPLFPAAIESFNLKAYDIIISSHHTVAKGLLRGAETLHVCYCHTPMRALWERSHEELETLPFVVRPLASALFRQLRVWDVATIPRVDLFLANSVTTQMRIKKHYGRDSIIVYPPIDVARFTPSYAPPGDYYLVASRLVPYKRVALAFEAAKLAQRRLIIVGNGPGRAALQKLGADLRGRVTDAELIELMRGARALIFPQYEDFGMTPVEMMACGRPVIAYGRGGAAETIVDGLTGVLVDEQTPAAFAAAMQRLESLNISAAACRARAEEFSYDRFADRLSDAVSDAYRQRNS